MLSAWPRLQEGYDLQETKQESVSISSTRNAIIILTLGVEKLLILRSKYSFSHPRLMDLDLNLETGDDRRKIEGLQTPRLFKTISL